MNIDVVINLIYIVAVILFIAGLKMMSSPESARLGNFISSIGMLLSIIATLLYQQVVDYRWIIIGVVIGTILGGITAQVVAMTAMPEMVALFNGFGGLASLIVGWVGSFEAVISNFTALVILLTIIIGGVTFTGSVVAWAKLAEAMPGKPVLFKGQGLLNIVIFVVLIILGVFYYYDMGGLAWPVVTFTSLSLILGILLVIPIGGADMPVVISLLNSYSGLAACAAGFVIINNVLIVTGALVGASGIILTQIMCKAMNRSLANVLFSGFGGETQKGLQVSGDTKPIKIEDAFLILEAASSVVIVPGYGMAVARAQHAIRELGELLEKNGTEVRYAIHPVAGRMPGHMNVLLAEANVPYDQLVEMDNINPIMGSVDVGIVVGANDVVNPAAREQQGSPIYGMPIINVDQARTVFVIKRSMRSGFAGIDNPLFFKENTRMLFGDAKEVAQGLVAEFKRK